MIILDVISIPLTKLTYLLRLIEIIFSSAHVSPKVSMY